MQIDIDQQEIVTLCHQHHIRKLALFGSVLSDHFRPDSDVDILVEFEPDAGITYIDLAEIRFALSDIVGREVDLLTPGALSRYFRRQVNRYGKGHL